MINNTFPLRDNIIALQGVVEGLEASIRTGQYLDLSDAVKGVVEAFSKVEHQMHNVQTLSRYLSVLQKHPNLRVSDYLLDTLEELERAPGVVIGGFVNGDSIVECSLNYQREANIEGLYAEEPF